MIRLKTVFLKEPLKYYNARFLCSYVEVSAKQNIVKQTSGSLQREFGIGTGGGLL
jgi:hypothetical protein